MKWKILIIDDDEDDFLIVKDMLKEAKGSKFDVHWAATYDEGRKELMSDRYNAVLVDYDLGIHSGIELIREANERGYSSPLILFTGRGSYEIDVEAMEAGATLYLTKGEANPLLIERAIRYAVEMKNKEQVLRESEAREREKAAEMNAILEAVPAIVMITHDRQAKVVTGNQVAYDFLRVPAGENISKSAPQDAPRNFKVLKDGQELAPEELHLQIAAATGKHIRNFEEEVEFEDGDRAHLIGNVTPLLDENGQPCGAVGAFLDITQHKRAEEALRLSDDRFSRAFNANPSAMMISRAEDGQIETINDSFERLMGYSREEVLGKNARDLNLYARLVDREAVVRQIKTDGYIRDLELGLYTKSGEARSFNVSVEMMDISGKNSLLSVFQDITEQKQAKERIQQLNQALLHRNLELENERARWQGVVEGIADEVWISDAQGQMSLINLPDMTAMGLEEFKDWPVEKVLEQVEILNPDGQPRPVEKSPLLRALKGEIVRGEEIMRHRKSGKTRYRQYSAAPTRDTKGQITGAVAIVHDITNLKQAEAALFKNEARLRDFLENTHDSFFILDRDWRFQYINQRFAEILQTTPEELMGKNIWEVYPNYMDTPVERHYRQVMEERKPALFEMGGLYSASWYDVSVYPVQEGIAVFAVDRSAEKKAQEELQLAYARLRFFVDANIIGVTLHQEDGLLVDANDYYLNLIGYSREELEAGLLNWRLLTPAEYLPFDERSIKALREGEISPAYEKEYLRKEGSRVWVLISRAMLPDGTFGAFVFDISDRKETK